MKQLSQYMVVVLCMIACSAPKKDQKENDTEPPSTTKISEESSSPSSGDKYEMAINFIDNRAIVYLNDSTIYDSETVTGIVDVTIDLTPYVSAGMTDLKVELYNGQPPYNTASPSWKIVYDIFINGELVEFVSEGERDGKVGLVHTELHDLKDIW